MSIVKECAIVTLMCVTMAGCGAKDSQPDGAGEKERVVQVQKVNPENTTPSENADPKATTRHLNILETYVRLRDGVTANGNVYEARDLLSRYKLTFSRVREANVVVGQRGGNECERFTHLFNGVGSQLARYFDLLLSSTPPSLETQKILIARLRVLQFFERSLFGMLLLRAEGGQSQLDPAQRKGCAVTDRVAWTNLILRMHQDLEQLSDHVLGVPSAMALADEAEEMRLLAREHMSHNTMKKVAWVIGEIAASILVWEKAVSPFLKTFVDMASVTPTGRFIRYATGTIYILGWVAFDRWARHVLPFLQSEPDVLDRTTISGWERVMKLGEQFLVSHLVSPPLYFAYAELLSLMRKETALQFITMNTEVLERAEQEFGSVDKAIEHYKEVIRHETQNSSVSGSTQREPRLVAN